METLINAIKQQALLEVGRKILTKIGTISGYDAITHTARVMLQPEEIETGWLPVLSLSASKDWGFIIQPTIGDQCLVHFVEGSQDNGVVGLFSFSNPVPPQTDGTAVFLFYHSNGAQVKINKTGEFSLKSATGQNAGVVSGKDIQLSATGKFNFTSQKFTILDGEVIGEAVTLKPMASPPSSAKEGMMYVNNSTGNHLYIYLNGSWTLVV
jgi:phage baseplate assembly protein V